MDRYKITVKQANGEFVYYTDSYDEDDIFINFVSNNYYHRVNKRDIIKVVDRKRDRNVSSK